MRELPQEPALDAEAELRALTHLGRWLRERGLKSSAIRDAIAQAALRRRGHFSVEELVADLKSGPRAEVHPATVYRVLPLLCEAGLLRMTLVSMGDGARYERAFERARHDHLICTSCGRVVEFEYEALALLQRDLARHFGFELHDQIHELLGTCQACRSGSPSPPEPKP